MSANPWGWTEQGPLVRGQQGTPIAGLRGGVVNPDGLIWAGSPRMSGPGMPNTSGGWVQPVEVPDETRALWNGIESINGMFRGRDGIYGQLRDDLYGAQANRLNENREETLRKLRFGLARTGLSGGSADIGAHGMEQRAYGRSLMDASESAQGLADEVRANDERTRLNLIAQMRAGLDQGNATQSALAQMAGNVDAARGANTYQAVDAYAQAMQPALANYQIQQGIQQARRNYTPYRMAAGSTGTITER